MSQETIQMETCWRATSPDSVIWVQWGDDHIAYHRPSGLTHFLNAASRKLLNEVLADTPDTATIAAAFPGDSPREISAEHDAEIVAMLARLEHLGLVERA